VGWSWATWWAHVCKCLDGFSSDSAFALLTAVLLLVQERANEPLSALFGTGQDAGRTRKVCERLSGFARGAGAEVSLKSLLEPLGIDIDVGKSESAERDTAQIDSGKVESTEKDRMQTESDNTAPRNLDKNKIDSGVSQSAAQDEERLEADRSVSGDGDGMQMEFGKSAQRNEEQVNSGNGDSGEHEEEQHMDVADADGSKTPEDPANSLTHHVSPL